MLTCCAVATYIHATCLLKGNCCIDTIKVSYLSILLTAPSRVGNVTLIKTIKHNNPALRVNWSIPQSDVTIFQYQVQYRNETTSWNTAANASVSTPTTTVILTRLDAGTEYNVRVRAVSDAGAGMWSVEQTKVTYNCE